MYSACAIAEIYQCGGAHIIPVHNMCLVLLGYYIFVNKLYLLKKDFMQICIFGVKQKNYNIVRFVYNVSSRNPKYLLC